MSQQKLRVLLVDDDPIQRRWMSRLTEMCGFDALVAVDGSEGLAVIRREAPDLVVTDVHMPRMHGPRMLELLRKIPGMSETPVIVVTADAARQTKIDLLRAGADDFILKPVDSEEFMARLKAHARRCNLTAELTIVRAERDEAQETLKRRADELERLMFGLITALEKANSLNDSETGNHIRRVCEFAALLSRSMGCSDEFVTHIHSYAGLHDVGKVGIRDAILKKPGKLTAAEFEEMKTHTLIGAELLSSAGLPQMAINIPLCHHERWDGSGYPRGLRGSHIPLEARIVAVADVFDALRSRRCYKPAFTYEQAEQILMDSAGSHFDPVIVERFLSNREAIELIEREFSDDEPIEELTAVWA